MYNSQYNYSNPYYNQYITNYHINSQNHQQQNNNQNQHNLIQQQRANINDLFDKEDEYSIPPSFDNSVHSINSTQTINTQNTNQTNQNSIPNPTYIVPNTLNYNQFPSFETNQPPEFNISGSFRIPVSNTYNNNLNQFKKQNNHEEKNNQVQLTEKDDYVLIQTPSKENQNQKENEQNIEVNDSRMIQIQLNDNKNDNYYDDNNNQNNNQNSNQNNFNNNDENNENDDKNKRNETTIFIDENLEQIQMTNSIQTISIQELKPIDYVNDQANAMVMKKLLLIGLLFYPIYLLIAIVFKGSNDKKVKRGVVISTVLFVLGVLLSLLMFILISFNLI